VATVLVSLVASLIVSCRRAAAAAAAVRRSAEASVVPSYGDGTIRGASHSLSIIKVTENRLLSNYVLRHGCCWRRTLTN
jgi:hypothetical protein